MRALVLVACLKQCLRGVCGAACHPFTVTSGQAVDSCARHGGRATAGAVECQEALSASGSVQVALQDEEDRARGCWLEESNNMFYFNKAAAGPDCSEARPCVCCAEASEQADESGCSVQLLESGSGDECKSRAGSLTQCADLATLHPQIPQDTLVRAQDSGSHPHGCYWEAAAAGIGRLWFNTGGEEVLCNQEQQCLCCRRLELSEFEALGCVPATRSDEAEEKVCSGAILHAQHCTWAARQHSWLDKNASALEQDAPDRPPGCWWQPAGPQQEQGTLYFNSHRESAVLCSDEHRCVCCGSSTPTSTTTLPPLDCAAELVESGLPSTACVEVAENAATCFSTGRAMHQLASQIKMHHDEILEVTDSSMPTGCVWQPDPDDHGHLYFNLAPASASACDASSMCLCCPRSTTRTNSTLTVANVNYEQLIQDASLTQDFKAAIEASFTEVLEQRAKGEIVDEVSLVSGSVVATVTIETSDVVGWLVELADSQSAITQQANAKLEEITGLADIQTGPISVELDVPGTEPITTPPTTPPPQAVPEVPPQAAGSTGANAASSKIVAFVGGGGFLVLACCFCLVTCCRHHSHVPDKKDEKDEKDAEKNPRGEGEATTTDSVSTVEPEAAPQIAAQSPQRRALVVAAFTALDADGDGLLFCKDLRPLGQVLGFRGSQEDWLVEYVKLCKDAGIDSAEGVDFQLFTQMVNADALDCHCSDEHLTMMIAVGLDSASSPSRMVASDNYVQVDASSRSPQSAFCCSPSG